mgnify:CR=1
MKSSADKRSTKTPDYTNGVTWVKLRDGRRIARPPEGGKFSRDEIRKAVQAALEGRREREAG